MTMIITTRRVISPLFGCRNMMQNKTVNYSAFTISLKPESFMRFENPG